MDPVSAAFTAVTIGEFALKGASQVALLIERLADHQRTLAEAEKAADDASARLDAPPTESRQA